MQVNAISLPPLWCEGFIPQQTCIVWPLQTASCICLATQVSCTHIPKYKLLYWTTQSKPHHRLRGQHKVSLRHLRHTDSLAPPCQHHVGNNLILSSPFSHRKVEDSLSKWTPNDLSSEWYPVQLLPYLLLVLRFHRKQSLNHHCPVT